MLTSLFETYSAQLDAIKKAHPKAISNIYEDADTLKDMCASAQAQFFSSPNCALLFTLKHGMFYECWYIAADTQSLESALQGFLHIYDSGLPIRFTLVGKDATSCPAGEILTRLGYTRTTLARRSSRIECAIVNILQDDYNADCVEFAKPDDAQELYALLSEEFDVFADNLPEFTQIQENINKQQVVIIRKDKKIALAHYFVVKNNILYGYYDVVLPEYRKEQLYFSLVLFLHKYIQDNNIRRSYDWRNIEKKRLAKNPAIRIDEKATIHIHFYVYTPQVNTMGTLQNAIDMDNLTSEYTKACAAIKQAHSHTLTNIYNNAQHVQTILNTPTSKLFITHDCLCILHMQHESFYDLFYLAKDATSLEYALQALRKTYAESLNTKEILPLRCMIAGKDSETATPCEALCNAAFPLHKKLIRRRILPFTDNDLTLLENFTADTPLSMLEFAKTQDLEEIYTLLCEEFDLYGDNIPEIQAMKENIEKEQVLVIRKDGKIAFIHYFYIINKIYYDYFELTHKDYRQEPFYFYYLLYRHMYLQECNIKRLYEWRDVANTRLVKMPLVKYANDESIYINFHLHTAFPLDKAHD